MHLATFIQCLRQHARIARRLPLGCLVLQQTPKCRSSSRWQQRQAGDKYAREAKVHGLKSRAAFKLLEMDARHRIFRPGQTVIDLGFAPGSWSQVAVDRTKQGRVIGVDIIPAQPPRGVSTVQGDFQSAKVQEALRTLIRENARQSETITSDAEGSNGAASGESYFNATTMTTRREDGAEGEDASTGLSPSVDVILSDMSEPWEQTAGFASKSISNPYRRMMNTSGINFRDHVGSIDLCDAALRFAFDTLKPGGSFICKYYQGSEAKILEQRLKRLFSKVHRDKPEASRSESREAYFVALRRRKNIQATEIWKDDVGV